MQDTRELEALFARDSNEMKIPVYNDRQFTYISDSKNNADSIFFDNQATMNGVYSMSDAFIVLPITITFPTYAANGVNFPSNDRINLALKTSTAELISGIYFSLSDGQTILQEVNAPCLVNPFRKLLEFNSLGLNGRAPEIQYQPDSFPNLPGSELNNSTAFFNQALNRLSYDGTGQNSVQRNVSFSCAITCTIAGNQISIPGLQVLFRNPLETGNVFLVTTTGGGNLFAGTLYYVAQVINDTTFTASATIGGAIIPITVGDNAGRINFLPQPNTLFNEGFSKRIQYRKKFSKVSTNGTALTIAYTPIIYLKDIHDIFRQWDFPYTNIRWQMTLNLSYPIATTGEYNAFMHDGTLPNNNTDMLITYNRDQKARLYMKQITLASDQITELQKRLEVKDGFTKHLVFAESSLNKFNAPAASNGLSTPQTYTVSNSITGVKRVVIGVYAEGATRSFLTGLNPTIPLNTCEMKINNVPLEKYRNTLDRELYQTLKEQTHKAGESNTDASVINYHTYTQGLHTYYVFDFQRLGIRPNENVPIQIQITLQAVSGIGIGCDVLVFVEREAHVMLYVDKNSARIKKDYL